jgi:hypothetical protein
MDLSPSGLIFSGKPGELRTREAQRDSGGQPSELSEEARRSERVTVRGRTSKTWSGLAGNRKIGCVERRDPEAGDRTGEIVGTTRRVGNCATGCSRREVIAGDCGGGAPATQIDG